MLSLAWEPGFLSIMTLSTSLPEIGRLLRRLSTRTLWPWLQGTGSGSLPTLKSTGTWSNSCRNIGESLIKYTRTHSLLRKLYLYIGEGDMITPLLRISRVTLNSQIYLFWLKQRITCRNSSQITGKCRLLIIMTGLNGTQTSSSQHTPSSAKKSATYLKPVDCGNWKAILIIKVMVLS